MPVSPDKPATQRATILVVDDEPNMCRILEKTLSLEGHEVAAFTQSERALAALGDVSPDVVLTDLMMPGIDGMAMLEAVKAHDASIPVVVLTAHGSIEGAVNAIKSGAFDYATKPFLTEELLLTINKALEIRRLRDERSSVEELWRRSQHDDEPVGVSEAWRAVMDLVNKVSVSPSAVLIHGETGVGKEVIAQTIHRRSGRSAGRFVPINCAAIPETLIESELFGFERGAFTGASSRKLGLIELANGGTLFLDEIGELPLAMQAKLLRVLQDGQVQRLGATRAAQADVRVIAATNRNLVEETQAGRFREDLYYRLNVLAVEIPPLRRRRDDIPALTEHFVAEIAREAGRDAPGISDDAAHALRRYRWPGNARELRNVLERTIALLDGDTIGTDDLPIDLAQAALENLTPLPTSFLEGGSYQDARDRFEREFMVRALERTEGNVSAAARTAGMSRRNFYEKLEKLNIDTGQFKKR